jgi:alpha/beta superfamily hydrolase
VRKRLPLDSIETIDRELFEETVWIESGDSLLEGRLIYDPYAEFCETILLLSPHPNFAGTMENNVILGLSSFLSQAGYGVLRFNYPGVGSSTINLAADLSVFDYWAEVEKEQRFLAALTPATDAFDFLLKSLGPAIQEIHVVGYSFGGIIGLLLKRLRPQIESVTAISMPWISRYDYDFLREVNGRKYFISGDRDFTFERDVQKRVWPTVHGPKEFQEVANDHFFRQSEEQLAALVMRNIAGKENF